MNNSTSVDLIVSTIAKIYFPIVVVVGLSGNIINLIILSQRQLIGLSSSIYLIGLAISDILVLIFQATFKYILYKAFKVTNPLWLFSFLCIYNHWLLVGAIRASFGITVAFTIERWISITFPIRGKLLCTKQRAKVHNSTIT